MEQAITEGLADLNFEDVKFSIALKSLVLILQMVLMT